MLRLAHRILSQGLTAEKSEWVDTRLFCKNIVKTVSHHTVLIADGYVDIAMQKELSTGMGTKYLQQCVAPIFDPLLIEWTFGNTDQEHFARYVRYQGFGNKVIQAGAFIDCICRDALSAMLAASTHDTYCAKQFNADSVVLVTFVVATDKCVFVVETSSFILLDKNGTYLHHGHRWDGCEIEQSRIQDELLSVAMLSLALSHAKNITRRDATNVVGPANKWLRRMKQPKITYRVLEIVEKSATKSATTGEPKSEGYVPRHMVRGNFANYTKEKPLFGRIAGTVWRPSHAKGKAENGIVLKDYSVKVGNVNYHRDFAPQQKETA